MHANIAFTFILALGGVIANPVAKPLTSVDNPALPLVAREEFGIVGEFIVDVAHQEQQIRRKVQVRDVGYLAPRGLSLLEKRQWNLQNRILRIVAQITVGAGQVLNEIVEVVFNGPGQVEPINNTPVTIGQTEIDEGQHTFTFFFNGDHDGWRWHGEVVLQEVGDIDTITQTFNPLQQLVGQNWVQRPGNQLQLGCGWAN